MGATQMSTHFLESSLQDLDHRKMQRYIAEQGMHYIENQDIVPVLGVTGMGKSTLISVMLGAYFETVEDEDGGSTLQIQSTVRTPSTSSGYESKTLQVAIFKPNKIFSNFTFVDTAGLLDSRGAEEKLWSINCTGTMFRLAKSVKAIIICFDGPSSIPWSRNLRKAYSEANIDIYDLLKSIEGIQKSLVFVIKNHDPRKNKKQYNAYCTKFLKQLREDEAKMKSKMQTQKAKMKMEKKSQEEAKMKKKTQGQEAKILDQEIGMQEKKAGMRDQETGMRDQETGMRDQETWMPDQETGMPDQETGMPNQEASQLDKKRLKEIKANIFVFTAFVESLKAGRVIFADPFGKPACDKLRNEVNACICSCQELSSSQLQSAPLNQGAGRFAEVLATVALNYSMLLKSRLRAYKKLYRVINNLKVEFESIDNGWEAYKKSCIDRNNEALRDLKGRRERLEREISTYSHSLTICTLEETKVYDSDGFFWCTASYSYDRGVPFVNIDVRQSQSGTVRWTQKDNNNGSARADIESALGRRVDMDFIVKVREKDHPSTITRIRSLTAELRRVDNVKVELENLIRRYQAANNKDSLKDIVGNRKRYWEEILDQTKEELEREIPTGDVLEYKLTRDHVRVGLYHLLSILQRKKALRSAPAGKISIEEFLQDCSEYEEWKRSKDIRKHVRQECQEVQKEDMRLSETQKPTLDPFQQPPRAYPDRKNCKGMDCKNDRVQDWGYEEVSTFVQGLGKGKHWGIIAGMLRVDEIDGVSLQSYTSAETLREDYPDMKKPHARTLAKEISKLFTS